MIRLFGEYFIEADEHNFVLCKDKKAKDKKTGEIKDAVEIKGYYASIKQCLDGLCRFETRKFIAEHDGNIKDLMKYINKLDKTIDKIILKAE